MRIEVDLKRCNNHGQCVFSAPEVFSLDDQGLLAFRAESTDRYVSPALDESQREQLQEASDMCPTLAITLMEDAP
ncbi:ferredoxin (plasmid) [Embleya sp. NBC_00888]|uniref:ferredoxin n=1 Tax=Embleya sp. NBC_00888 TaxID=2975960 RepID=UPI002F919B36|nr:ferredoxin [Embleya sp. NBC_00888]